MPASFPITLTVTAAPPTIVTPPASQTVMAGSNANFSVTPGGSPPFSYQWKFNGGDLAAQTYATLSLTNIQLINEGNYSVTVANAAGATTSSNAFLAVLIRPVLSDLQRGADGIVTMNLSGNTNRSYFLDITTNPPNWSALTTIAYTNGLMPLTDATATNVPLRFYRARLAP